MYNYTKTTILQDIVVQDIVVQDIVVQDIERRCGMSETSEGNQQDFYKEKPSNYALLSVLALLSFLPLGIVSQYYAFQVDKLYYQKGYEYAAKASKKALVYATISIFLGILITILMLAGAAWVFMFIAEQFSGGDVTGILQEQLDPLGPITGDGGGATNPEQSLLDLLGPDYGTENLDTIDDLLNQLNSSK